MLGEGGGEEGEGGRREREEGEEGEREEVLKEREGRSMRKQVGWVHYNTERFTRFKPAVKSFPSHHRDLSLFPFSSTLAGSAKVAKHTAYGKLSSHATTRGVSRDHTAAVETGVWLAEFADIHEVSTTRLCSLGISSRSKESLSAPTENSAPLWRE